MLCLQTNCSSLYCRRTIKCLSVGLLRLGLFFFIKSLVKLCLGFVTTNCCFMNCYRLRLYFFPHVATAPGGPGPPHCRGFTDTLSYTPHIRQDSSEQLISPIPDNTTLTRNRYPRPARDSNPQPSKREAADTRLRPRDNRDRLHYSEEREEALMWGMSFSQRC
jgi:hypothetical protein